MQPVVLPRSVKGQLYVHPVYRQRCLVQIGDQLTSRDTVPSKEGLKQGLKAADYIKCANNAKIFKECMDRSDLSEAQYLHDFLYSVATDPARLKWHICIAIKAGIDHAVVSTTAQAIYTNLYLIQYWDQAETANCH